MKITEQMTTDTEVALSHWWCGTDFKAWAEDPEVPSIVTNEGVRGAELLNTYDVATLELLSAWIGYCDASEGEGTEVTWQDFILATSIILGDELLARDGELES